MLGLTANAAKIRLHRARQALMPLLQQGFATTPSAHGGSTATFAPA